MKRDALLIYTDGACSGNPGPGGWGAIVLSPGGRVRELGGREARTTNNRMELGAAIAALRLVEGDAASVALYTDSTYLISGVTRWLHVWKRKGWTRVDGAETLNRDLWEELDRLSSARRGRLTWNYVRGHKGHPANTRCDELAVAFSRGKPPVLYDGPLLGYDVDLFPPAAQEPPVPERRRSPSAKGAGKEPAWYISLLDGRLEKHATWPECQARVHGKPALFRKVSSPEEEAAVLKKWGAA
ncbi:MAG: ribonuclease HI [Elusimicrobia bacterium]|nr:ribonuclease HI [Elusimicrobiota bacterium]